MDEKNAVMTEPRTDEINSRIKNNTKKLQAQKQRVYQDIPSLAHLRKIQTSFKNRSPGRYPGSKGGFIIQGQE